MDRDRTSLVTFASGGWAAALNLAERLPTAPQARDATAPLARDAAAPDATQLPEAARQRLERWRAAHRMPDGSSLAGRLAATGADLGALSELLVEPPALLAQRLERPGWAGQIAHAMAANPGSQPATGGSWQDELAESMWPLVADARRRIDQRLAGSATPDHVDVDAVAHEVCRQLSARLVELAARTLVLELNLARVHGRLRGATDRDRFLDFASQLSRGGLAAALAGYPVLARLLGKTCEQTVDNLVRIVTRFDRDRSLILRALVAGRDPGKLMAVEPAHGDAHRGGQSVARLTFANGSAVWYKPRSLALHHHFDTLVQWLNRRIPGLSLRTPRCLAREGYGWMEEITAAPCVDAQGVHIFYRRMGALLALLYAVDGTDFHYENLIASGDQPMLVDVETLFHPSLPPAAIPDPAADELASSVLKVGLVTVPLVGNDSVLDISGMGADKGAAFPFDTIRWERPGTDRMRLVRGRTTFTGADNRPRLACADAEPADYLDSVLGGFRAAYDAIASGRNDLLRPGGLLAGCAADEIRVLIRPTRAYATLLAESTHPDLLRDGLDREWLFDSLWVTSDDPVRQRLFAHEVHDLWNGDVPVFTATPATRDVWTAAGVRVPELLAAPPLDTVTARVRAMGGADRDRQEWLIAAALGTRSGPAGGCGCAGAAGWSSTRLPSRQTGRPGTGQPSPERLLTTALRIGDDVAGQALRGRGRVNWIGIEPVDERHWAVLPMGAGLADGYCGVALFLAQLATVSGADRFAQLAREAIRPLPRLIDNLGGRRELTVALGPGALLGLGGVCYALARLSRLLDDDELRRWLADAVDVACDTHDDALRIGDEETPDGAGSVRLDLADGLAGGLAAMLAVHADTGLDTAARLADRYARLLVTAADDHQDPMPAGLARGTAGIAWALHAYARQRSDLRASAAARAWLGRSQTHTTSETGPAGHGWCCGRAGVVLAAHSLDDNGAATATWLADAAARPLARNLSLCHGELGIADILAQLTADRVPGSAVQFERYAVGLAEAADEATAQSCGTPRSVPTPGLMHGQAGIGYGLLRLAYPERVPSVLALAAGPVA